MCLVWQVETLTVESLKEENTAYIDAFLKVEDTWVYIPTFNHNNLSLTLFLKTKPYPTELKHSR